MTTTEPVRTIEAPSRNGGIGTATLVALAMLAAVAPFGIDLYLSAFPAMTSDLSCSSR
jgi:DHA1 family bicyclomycin/chloramphenicol resistance-like MFS transporter